MTSHLFSGKILKFAFLAALMLSLGDLALAADSSKMAKVEGGWIYKEQPCAIFQEGKVLLVVNEEGKLGTAVMTGAKTFVIKGGEGWDVGLIGTVATNGKKIEWSNSTTWTRDR